MLLNTNKDLTCFPEKHKPKLCTHSISSLLDKSTVKMLFGRHYVKALIRATAYSVPIVPLGHIAMFGYSIYSQDFVPSYLSR